MKAVIYTRVSTAEQAGDDRVSLSEQEQDCRDYCQRMGWEVINIYQDTGYSGASRNRPGLRQMLKDAQDGLFDRIVAWEEDRLTRSAASYAIIQDAIEGTGIEVHSRTGKLDMLVFGIKALVGKQELEDKRKRSQMGPGARPRTAKLAANPLTGTELAKMATQPL